MVGQLQGSPHNYPVPAVLQSSSCLVSCSGAKFLSSHGIRSLHLQHPKQPVIRYLIISIQIRTSLSYQQRRGFEMIVDIVTVKLMKYLMPILSTSVVSGYHACLEIQGSRVQTRLRSMDFFSGRKNPEHKSSRRTLSWGSRV